MQRKHFEKTFRGSTEHLPAIRQFVVGSVRTLGGSEDDVFACELAADEAATNAFVHAYEGKRGEIKIRVWREDGDVVLSLHDRGKRFDPGHVPVPNFNAPLEARRPGGFGIFIIRRLMDQVAYDFDGNAGNTLTMHRKLKSQPRRGKVI